MAAVLQRVKIGSVGTLPRQHDLVGVVGIAHPSISGQSGSVGDPHGTITVAALHAVGIHALGLVDLR